MNKDFHITYDESDSIKGLCVLLIMLGHTAALTMAPWCDYKIFEWLYRFHIYTFFIIPLFYKQHTSKTIKEVIKKSAKKLLIPYFVFYILSFVLYQLFIRKNLNFELILFLKGMCGFDNKWTTAATGVQMLWFPLSFFLYTILREVSKIHRVVSYTLYFLSICIYIYNCQLSWKFSNIHITVFHVLFCYFIAYSVFYIIRWLGQKSFYYILSIIFVILSIIVLIKRSQLLPGILSFSLCWTGFLFLAKHKLSKIHFLKYIGKISFPVYMIHFYVNFFFEIMFPQNPYFGLLEFLLSSFITITFVSLCKKCWIYKCIFP